MQALTEPPAPEPPSAPSLWRVFLLWVQVGVQSFGGGAATLTLIRQMAVVREEWLTDEQFMMDWALCQITPGINLIAFAILIGRRTNGIPGALLALAGLLVPSALLTIGMTAIYRQVQSLPVTQRVLQGLIPAAIGLGLVTAYNMGKPLTQAGIQDGWAIATLTILLLLSSGAVMLLKPAPSVVEVLAFGGLLFALANLIRHRWSNQAP